MVRQPNCLMRTRQSSIVMLWIAALAAGCQPCVDPAKTAASATQGASPRADAHAEPRQVMVFAAASTQEAIETLAKEFEHQRPGVKVEVSFAASSTLAQQIAGGASADLFLSANRQWVDFLRQKNLVAEQHDLLGNQLVAVVAADATLQIATPNDLTKSEVEHLALGDPDSVPAGIYAKEALARLGLWDELKEKIVAAGDVREALAHVETGAAEVAIVYATDAAISKKVKPAFPFDRELSEPIVYPLALVKQGVDPAARELYQYLQSPAAAAIFRQAGFHVQQAAGVQ